MGTLDNLRREAKRWLKDLRDGQPSARARLKAAWPEAPDAPVLRDVQHALAREHGFANWTAFKEAIAARRTEPATGVTSADHVERFLGYACWDHHTHGASAYDGNRNAALRLLRKHPDLPRMSLYTAIACGELDTVRRLVEADPAVAATKGGPRGWDPILYLCYARLPLPSLHQNAVAIAQLLLDAGANPNAYYMAGASNYSALVGVAGEGEQDAPRDQPYKSALYQLLLERGAGPYDMQVLYNTHFSGDMQWWLELTYQHDVRRGDISAWQDPAWDMLGMGGYGPGSYFVLKVAVAKNDLRLAEWALTHGAHPNLMTSSHPKFAPRRTHYQEAVIRGHLEMAELLARHGAAQRETTFEGEESFVAACLQLDRDRVRRMLADHPEYLRSPKAIFAAAELNRADVVELLLDLGVPIEVEDERKQRPLHVAAGNHALDVARLLIARGAGIDPRETQFNATPLGFAAYGNDRQMVDLLVPHTKSPWHLSWLGEVGRLREVLAADPALAGQRSAQDGTPLMRLPDDERKAVEVVDILLAHGADPSVQGR